ncbi:hypothetical protein F2Q69_00003404 [Brassica cretica]|uniref:Uncharacterized protein n=1 Tax=Brassica cretica TaxID=69181 RepID=A0A8S9PHA6_BRACR|nr:hypothetical protein F2Q69_00003404 [Brassica cretica]
MSRCRHLPFPHRLQHSASIQDGTSIVRLHGYADLVSSHVLGLVRGRARGTLAQGFIDQNRCNQYEKNLERGSIYTLTNFYASNSKVMYHVARSCASESIPFQILKPATISEGIFTMLLATLSWLMTSLSMSVQF